MAIVVDASLAAAWCLREPEGMATADRTIERMRTETAVVPGIFRHEMRNVLVIAERRNRIEAGAAEVHLADSATFGSSPTTTRMTTRYWYWQGVTA